MSVNERRVIISEHIIYTTAAYFLRSVLPFLINNKADYYSIEDRTSGMAQFVSASALGMALGPAMAALLSFVAKAGVSGDDSFWTVETAPGKS